jgi:hypothetical protein
MDMNEIKRRLKNPYFILAGASLIYKVLESFHIAPDIQVYQSFIDLATYIFIGVGIYHTFDAKEPESEE